MCGTIDMHAGTLWISCHAAKQAGHSAGQGLGEYIRHTGPASMPVERRNITSTIHREAA